MLYEFFASIELNDITESKVSAKKKQLKYVVLWKLKKSVKLNNFSDLIWANLM